MLAVCAQADEQRHLSWLTIETSSPKMKAVMKLALGCSRCTEKSHDTELIHPAEDETIFGVYWDRRF